MEKPYFLHFFDSYGEEWKLRFKYWTSSRSYVLTSGSADGEILWKLKSWKQGIQFTSLHPTTPRKTPFTLQFLVLTKMENPIHLALPRVFLKSFWPFLLVLSLNSVPREGREPGAVTNMLTMPVGFINSKLTVGEGSRSRGVTRK